MKMMKKTWLALLVLMLLYPQAWAAAYHDAPPSEVLEHLNRNLPDFALEDCILITGTPKGNFALCWSAMAHRAACWDTSTRMGATNTGCATTALCRRARGR
ncbi:MAG: hypothetical protein ACOX7B_06725 [Christensenellales bacterium]